MSAPKPGELPDFTKNAEQELKIHNRALAELTGDGSLTARVYLSRDRSLRYFVVEDSLGRVAIAGAEDAKSALTSFGNREVAVELHGMDAPLFEYACQIPLEYGGDHQSSEYRSNWSYVRETPLVREYYAQKRLPIPAVMPEQDLPPKAHPALAKLPSHAQRVIAALLAPSSDLSAEARARITMTLDVEGGEGAMRIVILGDRLGPAALAKELAK
jgi:hypothetical protein